MSDSKTQWILFGTVLAVILGALGGYYFPPAMISINFLATLFLNALKVIVFPLILTTIVVGITSLGDVRKVGRIALSTFSYFLVTSALAVGIGLALVMIFQPGSGAETTGWHIPQIFSQLQASNLDSFFNALIPDNLPKAVMNGNYLGIIVLAIIASLALTTIGRQGKIVIDFIKALNELVLKLVGLLLMAAPIGLFALVGNAVAQNAGSLDRIFANLSVFALIFLAGILIHGVIVLPLIMKIFAQQSPIATFRNMLPALSTAIGTGSSAASLSITYDCMANRQKTDQRACSFVLPFGAVVNVDGTAMYVIMATLFIAQMFGVSLSVVQLALMTLAAIIFSFGISAIPYAALFLAVVLFDIGDFPPAAYAGLGILFATEWFFGRFRAVLDVWGDAVGTSVVAETFDFKTVRRTSRTTTRRTERSPSARASSRRDTSRRTPARSTREPERRDRRERGRDSRSDQRPERRERSTHRRDEQNGQSPTRRSGTDRPERRSRPERSTERRDVGVRKAPAAPVSPFEIKSTDAHHFDLESSPKDAPSSARPPSRKPHVMQKPPDLPKPPSRSGSTRRARPEKKAPTTETVERELSRVAAQLASLEKNKEAAAVVENKPQKPVPEPTATHKTPVTRTEDDFPKVDFFESENTVPTAVSDRETKPPQEKSAEKIDRETEPIVSKVTEEPKAAEKDAVKEPAPVHYGRGRSRRSETKTDATESKAETGSESHEEEADMSYSLAKQSFGRTKKKRVR